MVLSTTCRRLATATALLLVGAAALGAALAPPASAFIPTIQPTWAKSLDSGLRLEDGLNDVLVAPDGTVWACGWGLQGRVGNDRDMYLVRIPAAGVKAYKYRWDSGAHKEDVALALARAGNGSIYTVGYSTNRLTGADLRIVKWSATGRVIWTRRADGPAHDADQGVDVAVDRYGNVTVCGRCTGTADGWDWLVVSWSSAGALRWKFRYDREGENWPDAARGLCVDATGNVYVTGVATRDWDSEVATTIKFSRAGKVLWRRTYNGAGGRAAILSIARAPVGGVYVAGYSQLSSQTGQLILHYTPGGVRSVLVETADAPAGGRANSLAVATDGTIVTGGAQRNEFDNWERVLWHFDAAGSLLSSWASSIGELAMNTTTSDVAADKAGNAFLVGALHADGTPDHQLTPVIERRSLSGAGGDWNGGWSAGGSCRPAKCTTSGSALYVVGQQWLTAVNSNMFVLKYQQ